MSDAKVTPTRQDLDAAGRVVAAWRTWWGELVDRWPTDLALPDVPGLPSRLRFADDIAEALAAARVDGVRRGIEAAADALDEAGVDGSFSIRSLDATAIAAGK